ncbi:putative lipid II flippase FtsW [Pseudarthrobacter sp. R1]|uniref:putative lipid II flippase FtsW n=1 Tax=Pseudarthrobacter sp. R1 TaxID=2944934 RepID=UPI00210EA384|nr:putative lipid II flippase FtsW [Pseudarthrobacter sp. R1]MCQ6270451.1 putative lipid II flippase FtsW [Pseudarthrobacter sp. R1]
MVSTPTRPQPAKQQPVKQQQAGKPRPGSSATAGARQSTATARLRTVYRRFWSALEGTGTSRNGSTYYLILGSTLALTAIGIMMVLSASSVESIAAGKSPYGDALKQGMFAAIGIFTMFVLSRINVTWLKRLAWPAIGAAVVLLALVQVVGDEVNGNKNWIDLGGITFQPSEASKLALALWMATVLAMKGKLLSRAVHVFVPAVPMAIIIVGLVLVGNDLGTAMIIMMITAVALFFAGAPLYLFGIAGLAAAAGTAVMAVTSSNRMCRITSWWTGESCANGIDANYQATNGLYGLASGGWFGVGLGQSRQKYSWIPEAHNDFIFAIIGEELGLVGTVVVLILFAILGAAIYRVVVAQEGMFHRVLAGTIMVWLLGQATVNMSVVTGLMPVIGVPLPFISYGGSALLMSLCAIGVVLSLAREQMAPAIRPKRMLKFKAKQAPATTPKKKTARKRA